MRNARQRARPSLANLHPNAGRGADAVGKRLGSLGKQGLQAVSLGHRSIAPREHRRYGLERRGVLDQSHVSNPRQGFTSQVVLRRPEPSREDDQAGPFGGDSKRVDIFVEIVPQGRVKPDGNAERGEFAAQPLAIRVERLSTDKFATDRDDFGFHETR